MLKSASAPSATARKASARRAVSGPTTLGREDRSRSLRRASTSPLPGAPCAGSGIRREAEPISHPEDGFDHPGVAGITFNLAPEVLHMGVDRALVALELVAPHSIDQLVAGVDASRRAGEGNQNPPLGGGQLDGLTPQ